jgi:hypothetical protein
MRTQPASVSSASSRAGGEQGLRRDHGPVRVERVDGRTGEQPEQGEREELA